MIKYAFFDVDGTLSVPRYFMHGEMTLGTTDEEWIEFCRVHGKDSYENCLTSPPVRRFAEALHKEGARLYVLSAITSDYETEGKTEFVSKRYPGLFEDFFYVRHESEKVPFILAFAEKAGCAPEETMLVEDSLGILFPANCAGIVPKHISMLTANEV